MVVRFNDSICLSVELRIVSSAGFDDLVSCVLESLWSADTCQLIKVKKGDGRNIQGSPMNRDFSGAGTSDMLLLFALGVPLGFGVGCNSILPFFVMVFVALEHKVFGADVLALDGGSGAADGDIG